MLANNNRLKKSKDIVNTLKFGKRYDTLFCKITIYSPPQNTKAKIYQNYDKFGKFLGNAQPSDQKPSEKIGIESKLCIIVSAKQGKAHDRNKFKRRVKYILKSDLKSLQNLNIIVAPKSNINSKTISFTELKKDLEFIKNLNV